MATVNESESRMEALAQSQVAAYWPIVQFKRKGLSSIKLTVGECDVIQKRLARSLILGIIVPAQFTIANNDGSMRAQREQVCCQLSPERSASFDMRRISRYRLSWPGPYQYTKLR